MNNFEDLLTTTDNLQKEVYSIAKKQIPEIKQQLSALSPGGDETINSQLQSLSQSVGSLSTRVDAVEDQNTTMSTDIDEIESDVHRIDLQAASATLSIEDLQDSLSSLQSAITSLTDRVENLEDNSSATQMTVIYDWESTDEDENRGMTNGFYAGLGINHNFSQYKYIKLYFRVPFWSIRTVKTEDIWVGDSRFAYISPTANTQLVISTLKLNASMSNLSFLSTYILKFSGDCETDATVTFTETDQRTYGMIERVEGYK